MFEKSKTTLISSTKLKKRKQSYFFHFRPRIRDLAKLFSIRERSSITSVCLRGWGLSQNADTADALEGVGGRGVKAKNSDTLRGRGGKSALIGER